MLKFIFSKLKNSSKSVTPTYDPGAPGGVLTVPTYRDHLLDILSERQILTSPDLMLKLIKFDPDVSAAWNAMLTLANTKITIVAKDLNENIDREATKKVYQIVRALTTRYDYSKKFQLKPKLFSICEQLRTILLLRGAIALEVIMGKDDLPSELRIVDPASIEWEEKSPGVYKPTQKVKGQNKNTSLDLPNFFVSFFRRDPTSIYGYSSYVSAINTIAARQQVINDLYRIMQITGYPRLSVKVFEEVLINSAPANIKNNPDELRKFVEARLQEISTKFSSLRPDQAVTHLDSIEMRIINEKNPGAALDISSIIETLNAQNQAGLKTMATIIGRGNSGVNTASVEARVAAMYADELNYPLSEILSDAFTYMLNYTGYSGFVEVTFDFAELRPYLELEPQRTMLSSRLLTDLSRGIITDDEYHLKVYGRLRPDSAPILSGTNFLELNKITVDETEISPNNDPLGRSLSSKDFKNAKSNSVKNNTETP